ncbi:MAG: methionine--tRNA ligase [Parachlamydiales bacterium]|jgi:methionyl-tRNA synthetase
MQPKKILITSALPYANGPLHFGHIAGAYLPADSYARFERLMGSDVLYVCGSDEYGIAITLSSDLAGRTPQEHVEMFHRINRDFFRQLNFSFDHYSRTTWPGHIPTVQAFFLDLLKNGYIEEKTENHLYSEKEKRFLADRYVEGTCPKCGFEKARGDECGKCAASFEATDLINPRSRLTKSPLVLKPSKHWYVRFDLFKPRLMEWIKTKNWKPAVLGLAGQYLDDLKPRAITRDATWGVPIPLPKTEGKVLYVWFDAPIGYISAAKEWAETTGDPKKWEKYWLDPKTRLVHFIGKDNIPFHTVFFPAMIMGQNTPYKLPDEVPANEFLLLEGRQFSKSDDWYIDLKRFFASYSADQIRFYLAANAPESADAEFTWKEFQNCSNGLLLGKLGNFVNRVLVFVSKQTGGLIPEAKEESFSDEDRLFSKRMQELLDQIQKAYSAFSLRKAAALSMELAALGNTYFDFQKPWALAKDPDNLGKLANCLYLSLKCMQLLALALFPIIPASCQKIWAFLGFSSDLEKHRWPQVAKMPLPALQKLGAFSVLFRKIEDSEILQEMELLKKKQA